MITIAPKRLMYPEPEDSGSGSAANGSEPAETSQDNSQDDIFSAALDGKPLEGNSQPETDEDSTSYVLDVGEGHDYSDAEINIMREVGREVGIPAEQMSKAIQKMTAAFRKEEERIYNEEKAASIDALKKEWGNNFQRNIERAARVIRDMAVQFNWSNDDIESLRNAKDFKLFYQIGAKYGEAKTSGISAPVRTLSKEEARERNTQVIKDYFEARIKRNTEKMRSLYEEHKSLMKTVHGKDTDFILRKPE